MELGVKHHAHVHSITKASNHLYAYNILKEATKNTRNNNNDVIRNNVAAARRDEILCIKPVEIDSKQFMTKAFLRRPTPPRQVTPVSFKQDAVKNGADRGSITPSSRQISPRRVISPSKMSPKRMISPRNLSPEVMISHRNMSPERMISPRKMSPERMISSRKMSPKSMTSSRRMSPEMTISPRNMSPERIMSFQNNPSPKRIFPLTSSREVIKIDENHIFQATNNKINDFDRNRSLLNGFKKSKRKKASIDEILLQVEAKKRKEEFEQSASANHLGENVGEKRIPEIIPPLPSTRNSIAVTKNKDFLFKPARISPTMILTHNRIPSSSPPTLLSSPKPKTELNRRREIHYDVNPEANEKVVYIRNHETIPHHPPTLISTSDTNNYRDKAAEYQLHPNIKYSAFHQVRKEYKLVPHARESRQHVYHSPTTTPTCSSARDDIDNNEQHHNLTSVVDHTKTDNSSSIKTENLTRKKKKLPPNERYSNLTSSQLQRRLVANARERSRVHALSNAFDTLRSAIPSYSPEQKISKLTILRVAINYINALQEVLSSDPVHIYENRSFVGHVDECSCVLQTEYGRSKMKLSFD